MYKFIDTTEMPQINPLPAEAVCFNGVWLDTEIEGFRTLAVEGREFVSRSVDTYTVGSTDGSYYRSASYGSRTITVTYQIKAKDQYAYRETFNRLNSMLLATQAQLIFADEPDKYFIATRASFGAVPTGRNSVKGTIQFYCADPKKYAVKEKEFTGTADSGEILLDIRNTGNMSVPINYEIKCTSDNGYVGIENGEDYIRFGSTEEKDTESEKISEKLASFDDLVNAENHGGDVIVTTTVNGKVWLGDLNPSSGSGWHGAYKYITLPADNSGDVGAVNFDLYTRHWFQCALASERSEQTVQLYDTDGNIVCGITISKDNTSNDASTLTHIVNGKYVKSFDFQCGAATTNPFREDTGHNSIKKSGGTIQLYYYGKYYTYYDENLEEVAVTGIQFVSRDYGTKGMTRNYIGELTFQKTDVDSWNDVQNRYSAGADVEVNGEEGKLYVDGVPKLGDEIKGSEYFQATPGENSVSVHCSDWATGITATARIREAWI